MALELAAAELVRLRHGHEGKLKALDLGRRTLDENMKEIIRALETARNDHLREIESLDALRYDEISAYHKVVTELFAPLLPMTVWTIDAVPVDVKYLRQSVGTFSTETKALACLPSHRKYFHPIDWIPEGGHIEYDLVVVSRRVGPGSVAELQELDLVPDRFGLVSTQ